MSVPRELTEARRWLPWKYEWVGGKWKKPPFDVRTGEKAAWSDPETWTTYEEAVAATGYDGVGFVLGEDDEFVVLDLDGCVHDGEVAGWAAEIVGELDSYTELSPSGTGLHIFLRGAKPGAKCRRDLEDGRVEVYEASRFLTVSGDVFLDRGIEERQEELNAVYVRLFGEEKKSVPPRRSENLGGGFAGSDGDLLRRARKSNGAIRKLFDHGDASGFKSESEADLALCAMLAFWTGGDKGRLEELMWMSALVRDKWADHPSYLRRTVEKAVANCRRFYDPEAGRGLRGEEALCRREREGARPRGA